MELKFTIGCQRQKPERELRLGVDIETSFRCHAAGFICISIKLGKQGNLVNNMAIPLMAELLE